jgi:hypothetical protein
MPDERDNNSRIEFMCSGTVDMLRPALSALSNLPSAFVVIEHTFENESGPAFRRYIVARRTPEAMLEIGVIDTSQLPGGRTLVTLFPGKHVFMIDLKNYTPQHRAWFDEFEQVLVTRLAELGFVQTRGTEPPRRPFGFPRDAPE